MKVKAWIGIGSNLCNPQKQVRDALQEIGEINGVHSVRHSSLYSNPPVGPQDQPDYVNAVALIETDLKPEALLDALQALENAHQRKRERRWGARTLDLDILMYGDETISTDRLSVPHPLCSERIFTVLPILELEPDAILPDGTKFSSLTDRFDTGELKKLPE